MIKTFYFEMNSQVYNNVSLYIDMFERQCMKYETQNLKNKGADTCADIKFIKTRPL